MPIKKILPSGPEKAYCLSLLRYLSNEQYCSHQMFPQRGHWRAKSFEVNDIMPLL